MCGGALLKGPITRLVLQAYSSSDSMMCQTVLVANTPTASPQTAALQGPSPVSFSFTMGTASAAAALQVLQGAAAAGTNRAELLLPSNINPRCSQTSPGLSGMLKSWAMETGRSTFTQVGEVDNRASLKFTPAAPTPQPAFTDQEVRCAKCCTATQCACFPGKALPCRKCAARGCFYAESSGA